MGMSKKRVVQTPSKKKASRGMFEKEAIAMVIYLLAPIVLGLLAAIIAPRIFK
ncbi:MAG: hypothetical protein HQK60_06200 [Deltaproteobacteria bacterium]|nr:hypothetical protein [Deltaproteobacteria bacterium]